MSFQDQGNQNEGDKLTFKIGEREYDAESATNKIANQDTHIATLEGEATTSATTIADLQVKLAAATNIDEALEKLRTQQSASTQNSQTSTETPAVSEEKIGEIATKQLENYLATKAANENKTAAEELEKRTFRETGEALAKVYGDKTDEAMEAKAVELGITTAAIFEMAKKPESAKLLLASMKVSTSASQATPSGSFNTPSNSQEPPEKFMSYEKGITSSSIMDALDKGNARYKRA